MVSITPAPADVSALALEATLTAIKGAGWTTETLKAIKDAIDAVIPGVGDATQVKQDAIKAVVDAILVDTNTTLEAKLDALALICTDARLAQLDPANIPAGLIVITAFVDELETRLSAARAGNLDELDFDLQATLAAIVAAERGTDNALLAADYTAPDNAGIATLLTRITAAVALASALTTHDTDIKMLLATIAGYLDTEIAAILAAVDTEVAAIEVKLDTPANFMADLTTLESRLSAVRAGYLDELAAANIPADIDELKTSKGRLLQSMDFWSALKEEVQLDGDVAATIALGTVTIADLPSGATVVRAIGMFKFRMVENVHATIANKLDGATVANTSQVIQVADDTPGAYYDAINFVDDQFGIAATTREGGDVIIGSVNIAGAGKVDAIDGYLFRWLLALADEDYLNFNDVQVGIRIWYSV